MVVYTISFLFRSHRTAGISGNLGPPQPTAPTAAVPGGDLAAQTGGGSISLQTERAGHCGQEDPGGASKLPVGKRVSIWVCAGLKNGSFI